MKEYMNRFIAVAKAFSNLKTEYCMDNNVIVLNGENYTAVDISKLVRIHTIDAFGSKSTSFSILDASRIDEIPSIIGKCEEWLDNNKTINNG